MGIEEGGGEEREGKETDRYPLTETPRRKKMTFHLVLVKALHSEEGKQGAESLISNAIIATRKAIHMKANCWAKGRGKEGQGPKGKGKSQSKKEQAATATADSDNAAWMTYDCGSADIVLDDCGDISMICLKIRIMILKAAMMKTHQPSGFTIKLKAFLSRTMRAKHIHSMKLLCLHTTVNTAKLHKLSCVTQALHNTCPPITTALLILYPLSQRLL
jgi:hypothetical protein